MNYLHKDPSDKNWHHGTITINSEEERDLVLSKYYMAVVVRQKVYFITEKMIDTIQPMPGYPGLFTMKIKWGQNNDSRRTGIS